ncbi:MAG: hypothetical protein C0483_22575 [Pirellula sp.]|nr:hypothetical protein [Pirellula sp.]
MPADYLESASKPNLNFDAPLRFFSDDERQILTAEDLFAGRSVAWLFLAIITMGTLLMFGTVLYTL